MPLSWRIFQSLLWSTQSWTWQFHEIKEQAMNRMTALELTAVCMRAKLFQSCPTLCDPMDYSSPGSSVHGILQASILEQVSIPFSRASSQPRDQTHIFYISCIGRQVLYHYSHLGSPEFSCMFFQSAVYSERIPGKKYQAQEPRQKDWHLGMGREARLEKSVIVDWACTM